MKVRLVVTLTVKRGKQRKPRKVKIDVLRWLEFLVAIAALVVAILK